MKVTVAAVCVPDVKGDRDKNLAAALSITRELAEAGAQVVVTPESCLQGYPSAEESFSPDQLRDMAEPYDGEYAQAFRDAAKETSIYLVACYDRRDGQRVYNTAELIGPDGKTIGLYDKTHARIHPDTRLYTPGDVLPIFETEFGKMGLLICLDRTCSENWRIMMLQGAKIVLIPANGGYSESNTRRLQTMAMDNAVCCVFAHPKRGFVIGLDGKLLAHDEDSARPYALTELDLSDVEARQALKRSKRRPELYGLLTQPEGEDAGAT